MTRSLRLLAILSLVSLLSLPGCGGTGEPTPPTPANHAQAETRTTKSPSGTSTPVTPNVPIDRQDVVDVVQAEIHGGEADQGPTDESYYWQFPDETQIQDEPLLIDVPKVLGDLTPSAVVPASNPLTKGKYELGRLLFFDPRVSKNGTVSCATCHNPEKGWTDNLPTSVGILGQVGSRNAPTVINTAYGKSMFWDGRAPSLEAQAQGPIQNIIEMGDQSYEDIIKRLRQIPVYQDQFHKVFGTDVTLDGLAKAIATFERVAALSGNSRYDRYRDLDDPDHNQALSESQKRGLVLSGERLNDDDSFQPGVPLQKARCTLCHSGPNFTDEKFHNLGVGFDPASGKFADKGRWAVEPIGGKNLASLGAFKTPTLRDIERTAPYMHDGSEPTLEAVIDLYDKGGHPNPYLDPDMKPLNLTDQDKNDLLALMKALTGEPTPIDLPSLPPGPDGSAPNPRSVLEPPAKQAALNLNPHLPR